MLSSSACQKAKEAFLDKDYDTALELVERCIASSRRDALLKKDTSQSTDQIEGQLLKAQIYIAKLLYEDAEEIYEKLQPKLRGSDVTTSYYSGKLNYDLAQLYYLMDRSDDALHSLQRSKTAFIQAKRPQEAIDIIFDMHEFDQIKAETNNLRILYNELEDVNRSVKDKSKRRINSAQAKLNYANRLKYEDPKAAADLLHKAYGDFSKEKVSNLSGKVLVELATLEEKLNPVRAQKFLDEAYTNIEALDPVDQNIVRLKLGLLRFREGEIQEAKNMIKTAEAPDDSEQNPDLLFTYVNVLKSMYLFASSPEDYRMVLDMLEPTVKMSDNIGDKQTKVVSYLLEGLAYYDMGDHDQGQSKIKLAQILVGKSQREEQEVAGLPWASDLLVLLNQNDFSEKVNPKDLTPEVAENYYIAGMYFKILKEPSSVDLLKRSKSMFNNLSTQKFDAIISKIPFD